MSKGLVGGMLLFNSVLSTWKISCAWRMALPAPRPGGTGGTGLAYIFTSMGEFKVYRPYYCPKSLRVNIAPGCLVRAKTTPPSSPALPPDGFAGICETRPQGAGHAREIAPCKRSPRSTPSRSRPNATISISNILQRSTVQRAGGFIYALRRQSNFLEPS